MSYVVEKKLFTKTETIVNKNWKKPLQISVEISAINKNEFLVTRTFSPGAFNSESYTFNGKGNKQEFDGHYKCNKAYLKAYNNFYNVDDGSDGSNMSDRKSVV